MVFATGHHVKRIRRESGGLLRDPRIWIYSKEELDAGTQGHACHAARVVRTPPPVPMAPHPAAGYNPSALPGRSANTRGR
jgi:hypothetical protein